MKSPSPSSFLNMCTFRFCSNMNMSARRNAEISFITSFNFTRLLLRIRRNATQRYASILLINSIFMSIEKLCTFTFETTICQYNYWPGEKQASNKQSNNALCLHLPRCFKNNNWMFKINLFKYYTISWLYLFPLEKIQNC